MRTRISSRLPSMLVVDAIRYEEQKATLMFFSSLLPIGFSVLFVLSPLFTDLNRSKPVPERVTS